MHKPLSERRLKEIIRRSVYDCPLVLCRRVEEEHGIGIEETPKEHSEKPVQLELDMWP